MVMLRGEQPTSDNVARTLEKGTMMKTQRLTIILVILNLGLLSVVLTRGNPVLAQEQAQILRARGLELIDDAGQVRASFILESETVLRLFDANGTLRVKLGAGSTGSGLVLLDENTELGVQIIARREATPTNANTTSIGLTGSDGKRRLITP